MNAVVEFKAGGTFSYGCLVQLPSGTWSAKAQLRHSVGGALLAELEASLALPVSPETKHRLLLECPASLTSLWPVQSVVGDVLFIDASSPAVVLPTSTFAVSVTSGVTRR